MSNNNSIFGNVWQHPYVNIFGQCNITNGENIEKLGNISLSIDSTIGKSVWKLKGKVSAANTLTIPRKGKLLGLNGKFVYILLKAHSKRSFFAIHLDVSTKKNSIIRLSISNLYKRVKASEQAIHLPADYLQAKWTILALDMESLISGYSKSEYQSLRNIQFGSSMSVYNVVTSNVMYCENTWPKTLRFPIRKAEGTKSLYDWFWIYCKQKSKGDNVFQNDKSMNNENVLSSDQNQNSLNMNPSKQVQQQAHIKSNDIQSSPAIASNRILSTKHHKSSMSNMSEFEMKPPKYGAWSRKALNLNHIIGYTSKTCSNVLWGKGQQFIYSINSLIVIEDENGNQQFIHGHKSSIETLAISNNLSLLVSSSIDGVVKLWHINEDIRFVGDIELFDKNVKCLCISNDEQYLAAVGTDSHRRVLVGVWKINNHQNIELIAKQVSEWDINDIQFVPYSNSEHHLVTCGHENIRFWRIKNGHIPAVSVQLDQYSRNTFTIIGFESIYGAGDILQKRVFVGTQDGTLFQLNVHQRILECIYKLHQGSITSIALTEGFCVTGSEDGYIRVWPLDFSDYYLHVQHTFPISSVCVSLNGLQVLSACKNGAIGVLDLTSTEYTSKVRSHYNTITSITVDPINDRQQFVTTSTDNTIRIWCSKTFQQLYEFQSSKDNEVALSSCYDVDPTKHRIICGFDSGYIRVFDVATSSVAVSYKQHNTAVVSVLSSIEMKVILSISNDSIICIYDANSNYQPIRMLSPSKIPSHLLQTFTINHYQHIQWALSPNGKLLAVGAFDKITKQESTNSNNTTNNSNVNNLTSIVIIYECPSLKEVKRFTATKNGIVALQFSKNSNELMIITSSNHVRRYSVNEQCLINESNLVLSKRYASVLKNSCISLSEQGNIVLFGGQSNRFYIWKYNDEKESLQFQKCHTFNCTKAISDIKFMSTTNNKPLVLVAVDSCILAYNLEVEDREPLQTMSLESVNTSNTLETKDDHDTNKIIRMNTETSTIEQMSPIKAASIKPKHIVFDNINVQFESLCESYVALKRHIGTVQVSKIIGFNGYYRNSVLWHESTGLIAYASGSNILFDYVSLNSKNGLEKHITVNGSTFGGDISTLVCSNDGELVASGNSLPEPIRIWNPISGECILTLSLPPLPESYPSTWPHHNNGIQALAFGSSHNSLVSVGAYTKMKKGGHCYVCVWSWNPLARLEAYSRVFSVINDVLWISATRMFVTGGKELIVWVHAPNDAQLHRSLIDTFDETNEIICLAVCEYDEQLYILSGHKNGELIAWRPPDSTHEAIAGKWKLDDSRILSIHATDLSDITVGMGNGKVKHIELASPTAEDYKEISSSTLDGAVTSVSYANNCCVASTNSACVWFIDYDNNDPLPPCRLISGHYDTIQGVNISHCSKYIYSCSIDGSLRVWNNESGVQILHYQTNIAATTLCPHPDGNEIAIGYEDGTIRIVNILTSTTIARYTVNEISSISILKFINNGKTLLCGTTNGIIYQFIPSNIEPVLVIDYHRGYNIKAIEYGIFNNNINLCVFDSLGRLTKWNINNNNNNNIKLNNSRRSINYKLISVNNICNGNSNIQACFSDVSASLLYITSTESKNAEITDCSIWDISSMKSIASWQSDGIATCIQLFPNNERVLTGYKDGRTEVYAYRNNTKPAISLVPQSHAITALAINTTMDCIVTASFTQLSFYNASN